MLKSFFLIVFLLTAYFSQAMGFSEFSSKEQKLQEDGYFVEKTLHLVDVSKNGNYFFRSNMPRLKKDGKNVFSYEELLDEIRKQVPSLPKNVELRTLSFLNKFQESRLIRLEENFFKKNPEKGSTKRFGIINPTKARTTRYLERVYRWIHSKSDRPRVLVAHCRAGCDRMGFFASSYRLRFLKFNFQDAYKLSTQECGREMNSFMGFQLRSYCSYLQSKGYETGECKAPRS